MPKKNITLETPFKTGEKVMLVNPIPGHVEGQKGKVKLVAGLEWKRYWVRFDDGDLIGSVDHDDLVRPTMYQQWLDAKLEGERAAAAAAAGATEVAAAPAEVGGGGGGGIADQIPAALLERSKAAKARLAGG